MQHLKCVFLGGPPQPPKGAGKAQDLGLIVNEVLKPFEFLHGAKAYMGGPGPRVSHKSSGFSVWQSCRAEAPWHPACQCLAWDRPWTWPWQWAFLAHFDALAVLLSSTMSGVGASVPVPFLCLCSLSETFNCCERAPTPRVRFRCSLSRTRRWHL